jgi:hypothetical protein
VFRRTRDSRSAQRASARPGSQGSPRSARRSAALTPDSLRLEQQLRTAFGRRYSWERFDVDELVTVTARHGDVPKRHARGCRFQNHDRDPEVQRGSVLPSRDGSVLTSAEAPPRRCDRFRRRRPGELAERPHRGLPPMPLPGSHPGIPAGASIAPSADGHARPGELHPALDVNGDCPGAGSLPAQRLGMRSSSWADSPRGRAIEIIGTRREMRPA